MLMRMRPAYISYLINGFAMRPTRPTLRMKKRYVLARVLSEVLPSKEQLIRAILFEGAALYGDVGMSELALRLVHYREGWVVVRCQRGQEMRLLALFASMGSIAGEQCHALPVATTGTIRSATRRIAHTKG